MVLYINTRLLVMECLRFGQTIPMLKLLSYKCTVCAVFFFLFIYLFILLFLFKHMCNFLLNQKHVQISQMWECHCQIFNSMDKPCDIITTLTYIDITMAIHIRISHISMPLSNVLTVWTHQVIP